MTSITFDIRQALTGDEKHTSESVDRLLSDTTAEIDRVASAIDTDEDVLRDVNTHETELDDVQQRLNAAQLVFDRLTGAVPRLHELKTKIVEQERDNMQKTQYAQLVKRRNVVGKQLEEFIESLPAVANALHEAVQLKTAVQRFNHPATSGPTVNPMDVIVSKYDHLAPLVTDAVLKNTRLIGSDGTVLFSPTDASVSMPPPATLAPRPLANKSYLHDEMQYAQEMLPHDAERLQKLKQNAAQRGAPDLAQVAAAQGITGEQLQRIEDNASGKTVAAIQTKIDVEMDRRKQNARG